MRRDRERVPTIEIVDRILPLSSDPEADPSANGASTAAAVACRSASIFSTSSVPGAASSFLKIMNVDTPGFESTAREVEETFIEANPALTLTAWLW